VLNSNTFYCSSICANCIESSKFLIFLYVVNSIWKHLCGSWSLIPAKLRTQNGPPDSRLLPNAVSTRPRHRLHHSLVAFLVSRVPTVRNLFQFFSASHKMLTRPVKRGGSWLFTLRNYSLYPEDVTGWRFVFLCEHSKCAKLASILCWW
jgi:hypothetical protein